MSELPEIESVTIVTVDDRIVANAGTRPLADTPLFTHDIEFEGVVAGSVQIATAADAFSDWGFATPYLLLPALICALLSAVAGYLLGLRLDAVPELETVGGALAPEQPGEITEWFARGQSAEPDGIAGQGTHRRTGGSAPPRDTSGPSARRGRERPVQHRCTTDVPRRRSGPVLQSTCAALLLAESLEQLQRGTAHRRAPRDEIPLRRSRDDPFERRLSR